MARLIEKFSTGKMHLIVTSIIIGMVKDHYNYVAADQPIEYLFLLIYLN